MKRRITFLEILLICVLMAIGIAILFSFHVNKSHLSISRPIINDENILIIDNALKFYKLDNGFYPTTEQGLAALIKRPQTPPIPKHWRQYLDQIPMDNQAHDINYTFLGESNSPVYKLGP